MDGRAAFPRSVIAAADFEELPHERRDSSRKGAQEGRKVDGVPEDVADLLLPVSAHILGDKCARELDGRYEQRKQHREEIVGVGNCSECTQARLV